MHFLYSSLLLLFILFFTFSAGAVERVSLNTALERGKNNSGELSYWNSKIKAQALESDRVRGEFSPRLQSLIGVGPTTKITGSPLSSREEKGSIGAMFLGKFEFSYALINWGREKKYLDAVRAGVKLKEGEKRAAEQKLVYEIKESYYGVLYTKTLLDLVKDVEKEINGMLEEQKDKQARYRLNILKSQLAMEKASVEKGLLLAKDSLALRVGSPGSTILPKEEWLTERKRKLKPIDYYKGIFSKNKPEFQQLDAGIMAKNSLASAEDRGKYPVLALLAQYQFAHTRSRTRQQSVFAYDPYNRDDLMLGIGLRWDFQWGLQKAKAAKLRADSEELQYRKSYSREALFTLLKKAYWELQEVEKKMGAAKRARKNAKQWMNRVKMAWSSGLGDKEELVKSYKAKIVAEKSYYESLYQYHIAWAKFSLAVGTEVDPILDAR